MNSLHRSDSDKIIGGVCGGLAEYLRIDPLIVRILCVALAMSTGIGLVAYFILWILLPADDAKDLSHEEVVRSNIQEIGERARELRTEARQAFSTQGEPTEQRPQGDSNNYLIIGGLALVMAGLLILMGNFGLLWWFNIGKLWPLILIALGAAMLLNNLRSWR